MPLSNSLVTSLGNRLSGHSEAVGMSVGAKSRSAEKYSAPNRRICCGGYELPWVSVRKAGASQAGGVGERVGKIARNLSESFPALSAAMLDRELSAFKIRKAT